VALITHKTWQKHFGGTSNVLGPYVSGGQRRLHNRRGSAGDFDVP
jgi:hypothetical protein